MNQTLSILLHGINFPIPWLGKITPERTGRASDTLKRVQQLANIRNAWGLVNALNSLTTVSRFMPERLRTAAVNFTPEFLGEFTPTYQNGGHLVGDVLLDPPALSPTQASFVSLRYNDVTSSTFTDWLGTSRLIQTRDVNGTLRCTWPADAGIRGDLLPDSGWVSGSVFTISARPTRFPHAALDEAFTADNHVRQLVRVQRLDGAWSGAFSAVERNGLIFLACVLEGWRDE